VSEGASGKLCDFAALRERLSQKGICSRKGAKTQRNAEHSIAEKPRTRTAKSKTAVSWFLTISRQPLAKTFGTEVQPIFGPVGFLILY
jgi:hypothetical protein